MKALNLLLNFVLVIILPGIVSAQDTTGMDMKAYSQFAGYGFFALIFLIFSVLIYYTCHYKEEVVEEEKVIQTFVAIKPANVGFITPGFLKSLNLMHAMLLILIIIYTIIILTSII